MILSGVIVWCAVVLSDGSHVHRKGEIVYETTICEGYVCQPALRVQFNDKDVRVITENQCLYKKPKQETK